MRLKENGTYFVSGTLFQSANGLYSSSSLPSFGTPKQKVIVTKLYNKTTSISFVEKSIFKKPFVRFTNTCVSCILKIGNSTNYCNLNGMSKKIKF